LFSATQIPIARVVPIAIFFFAQTNQIALIVSVSVAPAKREEIALTFCPIQDY
jgi:hypothetical protein